MPEWETLTRILPYIRHKIMLRSSPEDYYAEVEEIQGQARAIHGHPMISEFVSEAGFTFVSLGPWCSALAALPSLELFTICLQEPETEKQRLLLSLGPLKELLRSPSARVVVFDDFYFTNELCHATANALEEDSSISDIIFDNECPFPVGVGGGAIIANALKTNASVINVQLCDDCDEALCNALAAVLGCNSTLQYLNVALPKKGAAGNWLSSIFLSLGINSTLKNFTTDIYNEFGDELCIAIKNGLAKNTALEALSLNNMIPSDADGALSARNTFSFLRTNTALKSLTVSFEHNHKESHVSAFRLEAVNMLENSFLESLTIIESDSRGIRNTCLNY